MCARKEQLLLGSEKAAKINYCSNTNNCALLYWYCGSKTVHDIPRSVCKKNQVKKYLQRHPIFHTDSDHNYIIIEIEHREKIEYEQNIRDDGDED